MPRSKKPPAIPPGRVPEAKEFDFHFEGVRDIKKRVFLSAFCSCGTLAGAGRASGIQAQNHHHWMRKDPQYAEYFHRAKEIAGDTLEEEARRRAMTGSDVLLIFLLKGFKPEKYRDNVHVEYEKLPDSVLDARIIELARKGGIALAPLGESAPEVSRFDN
jgi:hypothetical protein